AGQIADCRKLTARSLRKRQDERKLYSVHFNARHGEEKKIYNILQRAKRNSPSHKAFLSRMQRKGWALQQEGNGRGTSGCYFLDVKGFSQGFPVPHGFPVTNISVEKGITATHRGRD
ncbi:hypothetical protein HN011_011493, partial [Eciton burchellii]